MKSKLNLKVLMYASMLIFGAHSLDYSDLQAINVTCPKRDSCTTRTTQKFYERNCECDSHCSVYDDCCIDAPEASSRPTHASSSFTCMENGNRKSGVFVIGKCKPDWQGPKDVRIRCEDFSDLSDLSMAIPATNVQRNITFKNRYCSECNDAADSELRSWQIGITCPFLWDEDFPVDELLYNPRENKWGLNRDNDFRACKVAFVPPPFLVNNVRDCVINVTSACPKTWQEGEVKRMCESYMSITHYYSEAYRNPHCALCNGISIDSMRCNGGISGFATPLSFAMILDVNSNDGDVVGVPGSKVSPCPNGEKYDSVFKRCRESVCALPGTEMVNGKCVET